MGVEYQHHLAVADLSWRSSDKIEALEENISKVLSKWQLSDRCVERRFDNKRLLLDGQEWKERNQSFKAGASSVLQAERRLDWEPSETANEKIGGQTAEDEDAELGWIYLISGPYYKIVDDSYGVLERHEIEPFRCKKCGAVLQELPDPWYPSMLGSHTICPAECSCGGDVASASINFKSSLSDPVPRIAIWRSALTFDFGKSIPEFYKRAEIPNRKLVADVKKAFGSKVAEFGTWR